ncbi:MAG TPA: type II toxin-antitoxin system RelE/ParE family toxin [Ensifer sp.]|nr:type II toxin-antitoxin system RelE/ParE family toxin [Ensifer sp.]
MTYRIIYHPRAEAELDALYRDISGPAGFDIAGSFVRGLIDFIDSLEIFPERGSIRESRVPGLRIIGYRRSVSVVFTVGDETVQILGIFARGRDITEDILSERVK